MSDQQPVPEEPRESDASAVPPPPPATPAPAVPPPAPAAPQPPSAAPPPPSAAPPPPAPAAPPVWPAHAAGEPQQGVPVPPAYPAPGQGYPPPAYPPQGYGYPPAQTTSTTAIVGLVLAIVSWVLCPIVPAIIALVLAKKSNDEIAASQGRVGGEGLNTATKIVSWINIGLYAAIIVILGAFFLITLVLAAASGSAS